MTPCPACGGQVVADLTCHTYGQTRDDGTVQFMACLPCDSAIRYWCYPDDDEAEGCGWDYVDGLNPSNPRSSDNEAKRPAWLEGHVLWVDVGSVSSIAVKLSSVPWIWD